MSGDRQNLEIRAAVELRTAGGRLEGYASVFNQETDLRGFREVVAPGAFSHTLKSGGDVLALYGHDYNQVLGRRGAGTLELREDAHGLAFSIDPPATSLGRDLLVSVQRGDVAGASFGFVVEKERWAFPENQTPHRTIEQVELLEISLTAMPAFPQTSVALRSLQRARGRSGAGGTEPLARIRARAWLETVRLRR